MTSHFYKMLVISFSPKNFASLYLEGFPSYAINPSLALSFEPKTLRGTKMLLCWSISQGNNATSEWFCFNKRQIVDFFDTLE